MTNPEILTTVNIVLTVITIAVSYSNYTHIRQKDFQDSLYKIKVEAYKKLIEQCHDAWHQLDINSTPFVQIYDFNTKEEWEDYYKREVAGLVHIGFDIEKTIFKETMFLPAKVMDKVYEFTTKCIRYVVIASHFDTGLIIEQQDELHELFFEVVNTFRSDLGIEVIDESLKSRIGEMNSI
jgi:hypothetical protein